MSTNKYTRSANSVRNQGDDAYGSVAPPIYRTSNYRYDDADDYWALLNGERDVKQYRYARYLTPTENEVIKQVACLEGADGGVMLSSGMAAIFTTFLTFLQAGDHVAISNDSYYRSYAVLRDYFTKFNVKYSTYSSEDELSRVVTSDTKVIFLETPSNYYLNYISVEQASKLAKQHDCVLVVDNTVWSPVNYKPIEHGADLVIHSMSKYISGHNDAVAGAVVGRADLVADVQACKGYVGASCDPELAYLVHRGIKTLAIRMERINENALLLAESMHQNDQIDKVIYSHHQSHPQYEQILDSGSAGGGALMYCDLRKQPGKTDRQTVVDFLNSLNIALTCSSFGATETLARPAYMKVNSRYPRMVRISVGTEHAKDLVKDFEQALQEARRTK